MFNKLSWVGPDLAYVCAHPVLFQPVTHTLHVLPAGKPLEYFYRHLYLPQLGMFRALPADLNLGSFAEAPAKPVALGYADNGGFIKNGVEYK